MSPRAFVYGPLFGAILWALILLLAFAIVGAVESGGWLL